MTSLICSPQIPSSSRRELNEKVLVCLTQKEQKLFFPHNEFEQLPGVVQLFDTTTCTADAWHAALREWQPTVLVTCWMTPPLPDVYAKDPKLKLRYVCHLTGSVRNVVPRSLLLRGVAVTNWGRIAAAPVAEHALLLILAALRRMPRWREGLLVPFKKQTEYRTELYTRSLAGQRVGLHGFGGVAQHLVKLLKPFDVTISAYSAGVSAAAMASHDVRACNSLEELFSSNDVLVECEALTPQTKNSVTDELLRLLPRDAIFVNVGRGQLVDEPALLRRARAGDIRAALDVYYDEPLPLSEHSPMLDEPKLILSPHIAGPTYDLHAKCARFALANIERYLGGDPLEAQVTVDAYDRST